MEVYSVPKTRINISGSCSISEAHLILVEQFRYGGRFSLGKHYWVSRGCRVDQEPQANEQNTSKQRDAPKQGVHSHGPVD